MLLSCGNRQLDLSVVQVMGIVNVTPDSFSDGGSFHQFDIALRHAQQLVQDGATIIDIGGESTRPNAQPVNVQEVFFVFVEEMEIYPSSARPFTSVISASLNADSSHQQGGGHQEVRC